MRSIHVLLAVSILTLILLTAHCPRTKYRESFVGQVFKVVDDAAEGFASALFGTRAILSKADIKKFTTPLRNVFKNTENPGYGTLRDFINKYEKDIPDSWKGLNQKGRKQKFKDMLNAIKGSKIYKMEMSDGNTFYFRADNDEIVSDAFKKNGVFNDMDAVDQQKFLRDYQEALEIRFKNEGKSDPSLKAWREMTFLRDPSKYKSVELIKNSDIGKTMDDFKNITDTDFTPAQKQLRDELKKEGWVARYVNNPLIQTISVIGISVAAILIGIFVTPSYFKDDDEEGGYDPLTGDCPEGDMECVAQQWIDWMYENATMVGLSSCCSVIMCCCCCCMMMMVLLMGDSENNYY